MEQAGVRLPKAIMAWVKSKADTNKWSVGQTIRIIVEEKYSQEKKGVKK